MPEAAGLYIHIPFCRARCDYCDFATVAGRAASVPPYLGALLREIDRLAGAPIETLFIGGGTPTLLSPPQVRHLFDALRGRLDLSPLLEATVEANPESVSEEGLAAYRAAGINRISIGLQSAMDEELKRLGRVHTADDFHAALRMARAAGFSNVNVDVMFGVPGQTFDSWKRTVKTVLEADPAHVSTYALKLGSETPLGRRMGEPDGDAQADLYLAASAWLNDAGYAHYEVSNFARPGMACRHNLKVWRNETTFGVGVSAAGYRDGCRRTNTRDLDRYLDVSAPGWPFPEEMRLEGETRAKEDLMLALRLREGIPQADAEQLPPPMVQHFLARGLAMVENGRFRLTPEGWLLSNQLFAHLV